MSSDQSRRLKDKTTTDVAKAQIEADLDATREKTARLREQRLRIKAGQDAAVQNPSKPIKRRSRANSINKEGE